MGRTHPQPCAKLVEQHGASPGSAFYLSFLPKTLLSGWICDRSWGAWVFRPLAALTLLVYPSLLARPRVSMELGWGAGCCGGVDRGGSKLAGCSLQTNTPSSALPNPRHWECRTPGSQYLSAGALSTSAERRGPARHRPSSPGNGFCRSVRNGGGQGKVYVSGLVGSRTLSSVEGAG